MLFEIRVQTYDFATVVSQFLSEQPTNRRKNCVRLETRTFRTEWSITLSLFVYSLREKCAGNVELVELGARTRWRSGFDDLVYCVSRDLLRQQRRVLEIFVPERERTRPLCSSDCAWLKKWLRSRSRASRSRVCYSGLTYVGAYARTCTRSVCVYVYVTDVRVWERERRVWHVRRVGAIETNWNPRPNAAPCLSSWRKRSRNVCPPYTRCSQNKCWFFFFIVFIFLFSRRRNWM